MRELVENIEETLERTTVAFAGAWAERGLRFPSEELANLDITGVILHVNRLNLVYLDPRTGALTQLLEFVPALENLILMDYPDLPTVFNYSRVVSADIETEEVEPRTRSSFVGFRKDFFVRLPVTATKILILTGLMQLDMLQINL
jgi:hypothetical protein